MQIFRRRTEFQHFSQDRDAALGGSFPQDVDHGTRGLGVRVITIVPHNDAIAFDAFAAHFADGEATHRFAQPLGRDAEFSRDRNGRQQVAHRVPSGKFRLIIHA